MSSMLETRQLAKDYGDRPALQPLDLLIPAHEVVALIGHNGSGKSTLMKLAAGTLSPSSGEVIVAGHPAGSQPARAALSYLADSPTFYDDLSVWEHLEYVARLHGVEDWEETSTALLDHFGLAARKDDLPVTFSRGLRQKAALTLGFVRPFELLMVDEPFVGLDEFGRGALRELLAQAAIDGATVVVATHELSFAERAGRVVVLADGAIVHDGPDGLEAARRHLG
jgi:ABC-2 type transport system ATP-binding protein